MANELLNVEAHDKLSNWLREHGYNESMSRMQIDFADGSKAAAFLKNIWPEMVDIHDYPAGSNTHSKLTKWKLLNRNVLANLGLHQKKETLEQLAEGNAEVIKMLLFDIMNLKEAQDREDVVTIEEDKEQLTGGAGGGDGCEEADSVVPYSVYEEKFNEIVLQDIAIDAANAKIEHLKGVLKSQDEQIDQLCRQIAQMRVDLIYNGADKNPSSDKAADD